MIDKYELQNLESLISSVSDIKYKNIFNGLLDLIIENDDNIGNCDSTPEITTSQDTGIKFIAKGK